MTAWTNAAGPPEPTAAAHKDVINSMYCLMNDDGQFVAGYSVKSTVKWLAQPKRKHYLKTHIRTDKLGLGDQWRKMESRKNSTGLFKGKDLPYWTTPGVRTVVGPTIASQGVLRGIVTVELKTPDKARDTTVWRYDVERRIQCDTGT